MKIRYVIERGDILLERNSLNFFRCIKSPFDHENLIQVSDNVGNCISVIREDCIIIEKHDDPKSSITAKTPPMRTE